MLGKLWLGVFVVLVAIAMPGGGRAEDRDLSFVHALQTRGYGDTAVDYLETVKPTAPAEVKDVWDLEMSKSLRVAAQGASDVSTKAEFLKKAQEYLNLFAKNKPDRPEALQAQLANASMIIDQANEALWSAQTIQDPAGKSARLAEARKDFEVARPLLVAAAKNLADRMAKMGPAPVGDRLTKKQRDFVNERAGLEVNLIQARGQLSLLDYNIAQTYAAKAEDGKRRSALNAAADALDKIFQEYREQDPNTPEGRFAINAHSWTGKVDEELGAIDDAREIYDEVLANFQDFSKDRTIFPAQNAKENQKYVKTDIDDILTRTKHFSLLLLAKDPKQEKEYLARAREFIQNDEYKKNLRSEWGYQAAAMELAKHLAAAAEKEAKPSEKSKLTREALKIVGDLATIRGEFQRPAIELRNKLSTGGAENAQNVAEARELANIAFDKKQWEEAEKWYRKAQELEEARGAKKDLGVISQIQEQLASVAMQPISEDYNQVKDKGEFTKQKWIAWIEGSEKVAQDFKKTLVAQKGMGFALDCAAQLHRLAVEDEKTANAKQDKQAAKAATADREAALKRLTEAANFTQAAFPSTAEADKARMSLARVNAMDAKYKEALDVYEAIGPNSDMFAEASDMAGRIHFTRYLLEKKKKEADRNVKQMEEDRQKAIQHFTASIDRTEATLVKGKDAIPISMLETIDVLGQIRLDANEFKEARDLVEPYVAALSTAKPMQLDKTMLDIFAVAVRADLGLNDFKKAGDHGRVLIDIGPDTPEINAVLVNFVLRLDSERRKLQDALGAMSDTAPPAEAEKLRNDFSSIKNMLGDMLTKLAARQQMNPQTLVYIGNLFNDLDMTNEAEQQYGSVIAWANANPNFMKDKDNARLLNAVRAKQISLLRKRGKYQEAVEVANKLCADFPDALEPLVERARIYQDWALKDPAKYDDAIGNWTEIRRRLKTTIDRQGKSLDDRQKNLRQSYYDAVYNTADCLLAEAKQLESADKTAAAKKAVLGEQVLNAVMQVHPKLDGAEATIKKFDDMKLRLRAFRGTQPTAAPTPGNGASLNRRRWSSGFSLWVAT